MGKTILITGASGYIGAAIVRKYIDEGWNVVTAGRSIHNDVRIDFSKPESIYELPRIPERIDKVIHAAASHEVSCKEQPIEAMTVNVTGTRALLDWCRRQEVNGFTYISTFHVFGLNTGRLDEAVRPQPANDYGLTHYLAEEAVSMFGHNNELNVHIVRPGNIFGAPQSWIEFNRWTLAPFDFCRQAAETNQIVLRTSGRQVRNWVPLKSLVDDVFNNDNATSVRYQHVCGVELSVKNMADRICASWNKQFNGDAKVIAPVDVGVMAEPERTFTSEISYEDIALDFDAFVESTGNYLLERT